MINIYLTRHCKTVWNQEKRLQGHLDSPLTQEGIENIIALKNHIQNIHFDYVFASPITRAYQTAQILFDEAAIIQDDLLKEMNFGIFEGRRIEDILQTDHQLYHDLWHHPERFTSIPEGESYDDVIKRAQTFLKKLQLLEDNSTVMIVTHGMFFIVLLATMFQLDKKDFVKINQKVVEGCSLTLVQYENSKFHLSYYNQNEFLPHLSNTSFSK